MQRVFDWLVRRFVRYGTITLRYPSGATSRFATGSGPSVGVALRSWSAVRRIISDPGLTIGEAFMDGDLVIETGSVYDLLDLLMGNVMLGGAAPLLRARQWADRRFRPVAQFNPLGRARRNVAHHYDLNGRLYKLFLDRDLQYSCAYFRHGDESLDDAQAAKKRHIAAKLRLDRPGLTVLDIGSGWGGMAITLARDYGARVTGITLSTEQLADSRRRAEEAGLSDRVSFELLDYRQLDRTFDRIVSVGMFEHVGVVHYPTFFATVRRSLATDGVALLHTIGRSMGPATTNPWIKKYIFPGGYSPALSEVMPAIEGSSLVVTDIEVWRQHYATTLQHWRRRFAAKRDAVTALYDERFCRMFEFYLSGAEMAFKWEGHVVFQIQLSAKQLTVPITRDYIAQIENASERASVIA